MQCEMVDVCRLFIFHNHNVTGYEDAACVVLRRRCRRRSRTEVKELLYVKMALQFLENSCTDSRQTKLIQAFDWATIEADLRSSLDTISERYLCLFEAK